MVTEKVRQSRAACEVARDRQALPSKPGTGTL